jgi:DNA polymerase-3 subunit delta'
MQFSKVIGQEAVKKRLIRSVKEKRVSHAQLFHGPEGSGSLALALAYAQYLSCEDKLENDSCGQCPSCIKYEKLVHPDQHFVFPVATTKTMTKKDPVSDDFIKDWRGLVIDKPYITPNQWFEHIGIENKQGIINKWESNEIIRKFGLKTFESDYKIMIIWMPEKMNLTAANKLLKLIEEPPESSVFLLVSENTEQIIPTILSRTQMIKIRGIDESSILKALKEKYQVPEEDLVQAAHIAGGNFIKAIEAIEQSDYNEQNFSRFVEIMRLAYSRNLVKIFDWVEEIAVIGREYQKGFLAFALRMIRENYLLNLRNEQLVRLSVKEREFSDKFKSFIHPENAPMIADEFNQAFIHIEANAYARIVFLDLALKLVKLIR